jgi:hypothetical protein
MCSIFANIIVYVALYTLVGGVGEGRLQQKPKG